MNDSALSVTPGLTGLLPFLPPATSDRRIPSLDILILNQVLLCSESSYLFSALHIFSLLLQGISYCSHVIGLGAGTVASLSEGLLTHTQPSLPRALEGVRKVKKDLRVLEGRYEEVG